MSYRYTECGLDDVFIEKMDILRDDAGEEVVCIPNINGLHRAIAEAIVSRSSSMSGRELRFLRTEIGMTQAELASIVHREPLAISRWERGECPIDANAEAVIRLLVRESLGISSAMTVADTSKSCVQSAVPAPISIDGSDPDNYRPTFKQASRTRL